jgi:hypothetical protein
MLAFLGDVIGWIVDALLFVFIGIPLTIALFAFLGKYFWWTGIPGAED